MKHHETLVVGGVDAHADTHHAAALDERGGLLGSAGFAITTDGYHELLGWLTSFGTLELVAVESTGSMPPGWSAICAPRRCGCSRSTSPIRTTRRRLGKSDRLDAELAARAVLAGKARAIPKQTDGIVESIRQLRAVVTAPAPLREQLCEPKTLRGTASRCRRLRPALNELKQRAQAARFALRALARRIGLVRCPGPSASCARSRSA